MLEPYDGKLSRTVLRREGGGNTADPADYYPLVKRLHGQVVKLSPTSKSYVNPLDINLNYSEDENPLALKSDFVLSFCELVIGGKNGLEAIEKTVIDRAVQVIYRPYLADPRPENMPILSDLHVDEAFALAQEQKRRVDPMYHEKIDSLLDTYARKLAANMNHGYEIDARVPSILIAGGSNFPVRQKEKQNAARDSNMQEWQYIQGLLDKIRSTGMRC